MECINIYIPYLKGASQWTELKYALRSICSNLKTNFKVVLVGDKCPGIETDARIPHRAKEGPFSKVKDSIIKMRMIAEHSEGNDFLYWYDDQYLLQETGLEFFRKAYYLYDMDGMKIKGNNHRFMLASTRDRLLQDGLTAFNYENHMPRIFNGALMTYLIDFFKLEEDPLLIASLYFNFYEQKDIVKLNLRKDNIAIWFHGSAGEWSMGQREEIFPMAGKKTILNHNDAGLTEPVKNLLMSKFSEKCRYEL